jgi:hypothetical protein
MDNLHPILTVADVKFWCDESHGYPNWDFGLWTKGQNHYDYTWNLILIDKCWCFILNVKDSFDVSFNWPKTVCILTIQRCPGAIFKIRIIIYRIFKILAVFSQFLSKKNPKRSIFLRKALKNPWTNFDFWKKKKT